MIRTRIRSSERKSLERIDTTEADKKFTAKKNILMHHWSGYTNAGKSTLLNLLTDSQVLAEDKLFATLDSTTRALELKNNYTILISDTVGFIRKLPAHLIASFKSTLNEVRESDIILHVIDVSHPFFEEHIAVVDKTLKELDSDKKPQIRIFNKVDALENKQRMNYILNKYPDSIFISASRGINIGRLKEFLLEKLNRHFLKKQLN